METSEKASGKIDKLAQQATRALAFAGYVPDGADADRMVAQIARDHGLRTTGDTARRLASASGGDRAIVAREIEKIALFLDAGADDRTSVVEGKSVSVRVDTGGRGIL